jgi:hypothetical protein
MAQSGISLSPQAGRPCTHVPLAMAFPTVDVTTLVACNASLDDSMFPFFRLPSARRRRCTSRRARWRIPAWPTANLWRTASSPIRP